jgi:hypothetical protein
MGRNLGLRPLFYLQDVTVRRIHYAQNTHHRMRRWLYGVGLRHPRVIVPIDANYRTRADERGSYRLAIGTVIGAIGTIADIHTATDIADMAIAPITGPTATGLMRITEATVTRTIAGPALA